MNYDLIIFDADETLFDFKKAEKEAFKEMMIERNIDKDETDCFKIYKEINSAMWKELEKGLITQEKLKIERFERFSRALELNQKGEELACSYMEHLSRGSFLYKESEGVIEFLSAYAKLAIITNGLTKVQDRRIRQSSIARYFETVVISEEIGISKPDSRIFEYTLDLIGDINKDRILMVGDSLTSDIQGGINFGIDTCWCNLSQKVNNSDIKPTYEIRNLLELKEVVTR